MPADRRRYSVVDIFPYLECSYPFPLFLAILLPESKNLIVDKLFSSLSDNYSRLISDDDESRFAFETIVMVCNHYTKEKNNTSMYFASLVNLSLIKII